MFTGIIEGLGTITGIRPSDQAKHFTITSDFNLDQTKTGDSIAVSGTCLTVVRINGKCFEVDVALETLSRTTFDKANTGDRVNLERALRLTDRLDGHLVSGHIDGTAVITGKKHIGNAIIITIDVSESLSNYMINKGSVAVDGISLTINKYHANELEISIIPHTSALTTIGLKNVGDKVNIETDMIGKYVERFMEKRIGSGQNAKTAQSTLDMRFLEKTGFI